VSAQPKLSREVAALVEGYSAEELKRILASWEKYQQRWRKGRKEGQDTNRQRAAENRGRWRAHFEVLRRERPGASFDSLVWDVWRFCSDSKIRIGEREYSLSTIRRDLLAYTRLTKVAYTR